MIMRLDCDWEMVLNKSMRAPIVGFIRDSDQSDLSEIRERVALLQPYWLTICQPLHLWRYEQCQLTKPCQVYHAKNQARPRSSHCRRSFELAKNAQVVPRWLAHRFRASKTWLTVALPWHLPSGDRQARGDRNTVVAVKLSIVSLVDIKGLDLIITGVLRVFLSCRVVWLPKIQNRLGALGTKPRNPAIGQQREPDA